MVDITKVIKKTFDGTDWKGMEYNFLAVAKVSG